MIDRVVDGAFRLLEAVLVFLLAAMVVMVFGNVALRYGFNSGITVSEELSRYFFVWLTFIGAVVTFREHGHLGVDILVQSLPERARFVCIVLSDLIILLCCAVFFWGTWVQAPINATMESPVVGVSMLWIFGIGFFTSAGIGLITLVRLAQTCIGGLAARRDAEPLEADGLTVRDRAE